MKQFIADLGTLEPAQWSHALDAPLPRKTLRKRTFLLLFVLRLYVALAVPLVGLAFWRAIH